MIIGSAARRPWWPMTLVTDPGGPPVLVAATAGNGPVAAWDVRTGELLSEYTAAGVNGLTAGRLPDGRLVAAACGDHGIDRWDIDTGQPLPDPGGFEPDQYWSVALRGRLLAAAAQNGHGVVRRWDVLTGDSPGHLGPRAGHDRIVHNLIMAPGPVLISSDERGLVVRRDALTGVPVGEPLHVEADRIPLATVPYPGGHLLVAADGAGRVFRWDLWSGEPIGPPVQGPAGIVDVAAYTSSGRPVILVSCETDLVYRWDARTGAALGEPEPGTTLAAGAGLAVIGSAERDCRVRT
ncbi:WD40 repeat domain-containing protein [Actinoplanes sp. HUAS TT8]|uniref:WD40 repeat domain-containing protein n=1 Tax=Actinoplanes sp. HUAS TT8 TaxID=3447453 RepID=UPI003F52205B